ncbi:hypothetical protein FACS1894127_1620 [Clostridia bacterium]|nr:hypothetical protein FACS1894127_1620 [Clostridia bacterium]
MFNSGQNQAKLIYQSIVYPYLSIAPTGIIVNRKLINKGKLFIELFKILQREFKGFNEKTTKIPANINEQLSMG